MPEAELGSKQADFMSSTKSDQKSRDDSKLLSRYNNDNTVQNINDNDRAESKKMLLEHYVSHTSHGGLTKKLQEHIGLGRGSSIATDVNNNNDTSEGTNSHKVNQLRLILKKTSNERQVDTSTRSDLIPQGHSHHFSSGKPSVDSKSSNGLLVVRPNQQTTTHLKQNSLVVPPMHVGSLHTVPSSLPRNIDTSKLQPENHVRSNMTSSDALNYALMFGIPLVGCLMMLFTIWIIVKFCRKLGEKFQRSKNINQQTKFSGFGEHGAKGSMDKVDWDGVHVIDDKNDDHNIKTDKRLHNNLQSTVQFESSILVSQQNGTSKRIPQWHTILDERKSIDHSMRRSKTWGKRKLTKQKTIDLDDCRIQSFGQLRYSLSYDFDKTRLTIQILEARNLPSMDLCGFSDPYVKIYMLQNFGTTTGVVDTKTDNCLYKTRVHKRTLNPVFNETFQCEISYADLCQKTLVLSVYDYDRFSKHDEIGQLAIPLVSLDYSGEINVWGDLQKHEPISAQLGDICLSLRYVPTSGKLTVVVLEAARLKKMDVAGLSDPYVKLALMCNGVRLKKRKTSTKKCTLNPRYNESFSFEVPFDQIQNVQLVVTVTDYDRIGTSDPIGKISMGCANTTGETERCHWMNMLASPRRPIVQWHSLKPMANLESSISAMDDLSTTTGSASLGNGKDCLSLSDSASSH